MGVGAPMLRGLDISNNICTTIIFHLLLILILPVLLVRPCKERSFGGSAGFGAPIHGRPCPRGSPLLQRSHQATDDRQELLRPVTPEFIPQLMKEAEQVRVAKTVAQNCEIYEALALVVAVVVVVHEEGEGVGRNGFEVESVIRRDHLQAQRDKVVDLMVSGAVTVGNLAVLPYATVANPIIPRGIH